MNSKKIEELSSFQLEAECNNEEELKIKFLLPLIEALGHRRINLESKYMDITIEDLDSGYSLLFEAKHHTKKLENHIDQLKKYWDTKRHTLAILCNGKEMWIFHPFWIRKRSFNDTLLFKIAQKDLPKKIGILNDLLSHDAIATGSIQQKLTEYEKKHEENSKKLKELLLREEHIENQISDLKGELQKVKIAKSELTGETRFNTTGYNREQDNALNGSNNIISNHGLIVDILDLVNYFGLIEKKQIMYCTNRKVSRNDILLFSKNKETYNNYEFSQKGVEYYNDLANVNESFYVADIECLNLKKNDILMWEKLYDEGLFPYWDPERGPFSFNKNSLKSIAICRVFKIGNSFKREHLNKGQGHKRIINNEINSQIINNLKSKVAIIRDGEFDEKRERIISIFNEFN